MLEAIQNRSGLLPGNSFIIKENYRPDKTLAAVTVMYRVKGYDADAGDWFWAKYAADGKGEKMKKCKIWGVLLVIAFALSACATAHMIKCHEYGHVFDAQDHAFESYGNYPRETPDDLL